MQAQQQTAGNNYQYRVYGFRLESELRLPELQIDVAGDSEVVIRLGRVAARLNDESAASGNQLFVKAGSVFFQAPAVADYQIDGGNRITVELHDAADSNMVRLYLLGTVMGVLLMQRGVVPLHGSTVAVDGQGIIFTGVSGAGKSTLAAALHQCGYPLLADDVSAVCCDDRGMFQVYPAYPQQKLWQDSTRLLGVSVNDFSLVSPEWQKYAVPVGKDFYTEPLPVAAIYELWSGGGTDIVIRAMDGTAKIAAVMNNTYRAEFIGYLSMADQHFQQCAGLARQARVFQLTRPQHTATVAELAETVVRHFTSVASKDVLQMEA